MYYYYNYFYEALYIQFVKEQSGLFHLHITNDISLDKSSEGIAASISTSDQK